MRGHTQGGAFGRALTGAVHHMQRLITQRGKEAGLPAFRLGAGIGIDGAEDRIKGGIRAGGDGEFQSPADQQISGARRLGQQDRILIAHRQHRRAQRDTLGMLPHSGKERQRR